MVSGKFAITVHILTLLSKFPGEYLSSTFIADSINVNPVLVRKEIIDLKENHLVESKEGKNGGTKLAAGPKDISLAQIYRLTFETLSLGYSKNVPNPACSIGKQINKNLAVLYNNLDETMNAHLKNISLEDFANEF